MKGHTRQQLVALERAAGDVAQRLAALPAGPQRLALIASLEHSTKTDPVQRELDRLIAVKARALIAQEKTR